MSDWKRQNHRAAYTYQGWVWVGSMLYPSASFVHSAIDDGYSEHELPSVGEVAEMMGAPWLNPLVDALRAMHHAPAHPTWHGGPLHVHIDDRNTDLPVSLSWRDAFPWGDRYGSKAAAMREAWGERVDLLAPLWNERIEIERDVALVVHSERWRRLPK